MKSNIIVNHYDEVYFSYQAKHNELTAHANLFKFSEFLGAADRLIDFGCGGGFLLEAIGKENSIGIDVSAHAREAARARGVNALPCLEDVRDEWADLIISNHALEHVPDPFGVMKMMHRKLRSGGKIVICVPCDKANFPFKDEDIDFHLFSWSANNLGNLAKAAGFEVLEAAEVKHKWPPGWHVIYRMFGSRFFHMACRLYSIADRRRNQVRVVAEKKS